MTCVLTSAAPAMAVSRISSLATRPDYQSYLMLHIGFSVLPIVIGLDKFFHLSVNWDQYFMPLATQFIPVSDHALMLIVGVIEIAVGLLVAFRPRFGAYIAAVWLWGIVSW